MATAKFFAGVDVGSATTKAVLVDMDGDIVARSVIPSGGKLSVAADAALSNVLERGCIPRACIGTLVSTGYGRESVTGRTKSVTEITCHARGAHRLNPAARSVVDIGGQDSKAIALDENGGVRRFEMNDKCAAGTGRFLEVMARTLQVELDEIGPVSLTVNEPARISSTCTVFAESEVISLLAQDENVPRILAGLCFAISQRVNSLAARVGMVPVIMMTGGVAKNVGVVKWLEKAIGMPVTVPDEPQIVGALGAALIARNLDGRE